MMGRREVLTMGAGLAASCWSACRNSSPLPETRLDDYLSERMDALHIPGLAGLVVRNGDIVWSGAKGVADLDTGRAMTLDTVQNIASISKTVTTTALMQLWERGAFQLEDDVNQYLSFPVVNPNHPQEPITFAQLLTHVSSIADGTAYSRLYACGDPELSLGAWIEEYFTPGGRFYDASENFHDFAPGEAYAYNNVAFGLVGHLVEVLGEGAFPVQCERGIFQPLGMRDTGWIVTGIEPSRQAIPYTWVESGEARGPTWGGEAQGAIGQDGPSGSRIEADGYRANCFYNHPNYPDGFLRTSVRQLGAYLNAYLAGGAPILERETVDTMLRVRSEEIWGLSWYVRDVAGRPFWGHGGADPGVNTRIDLNPADGAGAIVFANTFIDDTTAEVRDISARLLAEAYS